MEKAVILGGSYAVSRSWLYYQPLRCIPGVLYTSERSYESSIEDHALKSRKYVC